MSEDELLSALKASELLKERIEKIIKNLKELRRKFSKSKINEIRKNLHETEKQKNLSSPKEIEKYLLDLKKIFLNRKKYYDYDDAEYKGIKSIRNLSVDKDYKPVIIDDAFRQFHSGNTIIERKTQEAWEIQLTKVINFICSIPDSDETRSMRTKSDNINVLIGSETDEIIEELFKYFLQRINKRKSFYF